MESQNVTSEEIGKAPSLAQMRNRMHDGHRRALEAARDGRRLNPSTDGEAFRDRTIVETLTRWTALDESGRLTDIGRALLVRPLNANDIDDPRCLLEPGVDDDAQYIEPFLEGAARV